MVRTVLATIFILISCQNIWAQSLVDSSRIVKILSFNILHGATTKNDFNLDNIARVIIDSNPDFVAMQEVDFRTNRAQKYDLVTELGWRTKMAPLFARAMPYDDGEYGEGILSKYSFLMTRNVALPFSTSNEPRAALEITTVLPSGDTISFIGTHLDHLQDETDKVAQAKKINQVFADNKYPTILAGDLNDVPGSRAINILEDFWTASYDKENPQPTFPSDNPTRKIDYVMYYPKQLWRVLDREVIQDTIASDHCAYLVTLEFLGHQ
jgi:endonuclease/exonuclease/phosphatase family metal-dependent hydrolase